MIATREQKIKLYMNLVRCKKLDELMVRRFHEGMVRPDDYIANSHRGGNCLSTEKENATGSRL